VTSAFDQRDVNRGMVRRDNALKHADVWPAAFTENMANPIRPPSPRSGLRWAAGRGSA